MFMTQLMPKNLHNENFTPKNAAYWKRYASGLKLQNDEIMDILKISKRNIESIQATCNCKTYDEWHNALNDIIEKYL